MGSEIDLNGKTHVVVGAGTARFETLVRGPFTKQRPGGPSPKEAKNDNIGAFKQDAVTKGKSNNHAPKMTREQWNEIWGQAKGSGGKTYMARSRLIVLPAKSSYAIKLYNEPIESVFVKGLKYSKTTLPPVIAALEMINFGRALSSLYKAEHLEAYKIAIPVLSLTSLSYYTLCAAVALSGKESAANTLGSTGKLLFFKEFRAFGNTFVIFDPAGAIVTGLSAIMATWDSIIRIMRDDYDAAACYATAAAALTGLSLAKLGLIEVTAFLGLAQWAVPLLIVGIIGTAMGFTLTDSDLKKWSKHGPFALAPDDRWRYKYERRRPQLALEGLVGALLMPSVTIEYRQTSSIKSVDLWPDIEVCFYTPGFDADKSKLKIDVTAQRGIHADGASATIKKTSGHEDYQQHLQQEYATMPVTNGTTNQIIGTKHFYKGLPPPPPVHTTGAFEHGTSQIRTAHRSFCRR